MLLMSQKTARCARSRDTEEGDGGRVSQSGGEMSWSWECDRELQKTTWSQRDNGYE